MSSYSNGKQSFENSEIEFNVIRRLGVLAKYNTGWAKEVNIISWNKGAKKLDIRDWDPDHLHMSKGITLYEEEAERLLRVLKTQFEEAKEGTAVIGRGWDTAQKSRDFKELDSLADREREERMRAADSEKSAEVRECATAEKRDKSENSYESGKDAESAKWDESEKHVESAKWDESGKHAENEALADMLEAEKDLEQLEGAALNLEELADAC